MERTNKQLTAGMDSIWKLTWQLSLFLFIDTQCKIGPWQTIQFRSAIKQQNLLSIVNINYPINQSYHILLFSPYRKTFFNFVWFDAIWRMSFFCFCFFHEECKSCLIVIQRWSKIKTDHLVFLYNRSIIKKCIYFAKISN